MTIHSFCAIVIAMQLIDGRALAAQAREHIRQDIVSQNLSPKLGVLLVGNDPASHLYVNLKEKAASEAGIATDVRRLPDTTSDGELLTIIQAWNNDPLVHAILVQLPLPPQHDTDAIIEVIDPRKDADGFHPKNIEALLNGTGKIIPPLHEGILRLIAASGITINLAQATVVGNSEIFQKPLTYLMQKAGARVTSCTPDELDRKQLLTSQIIVVAVGRPHFLSRELISSGTVVIDVGTNKTAEKTVVGDVDAESVKELSGWLSPVPGGVGPMTIAMLLKNVVELCKQQTLIGF